MLKKIYDFKYSFTIKAYFHCGTIVHNTIGLYYSSRNAKQKRLRAKSITGTFIIWRSRSETPTALCPAEEGGIVGNLEGFGQLWMLGGWGWKRGGLRPPPGSQESHLISGNWISRI